MINPRTILLLVAALTAAGLTAYFANSWLASQRAAFEAKVPEEKPQIEVAEVLVATRSLPTGSFIRAEDLVWKMWPEDGIIDDYLVRGEANEAELVGAVARTPLFAGEPITKSRVVHKGDQAFLAAVLEPDHRAVSVPIDATSGIAGFVFPGDFVDVLLTFSTAVKDDATDESATRYFSETLLRRVRVLAIDQTVDNEEGSAQVGRTATLEVTAKQAERISVALDIGHLSLSLHSIARKEVDLAGVIRKASLRDGRPDEAENGHSYTRDTDVLYMIGDPLGLPPPPGAGPRVNVLRGKDAEQVRF